MISREVSYMDIKDLTVFKKVAEEGSISKAAKSLSYVQSNVTMKIKQLEDELGVPYFTGTERSYFKF